MKKIMKQRVLRMRIKSRPLFGWTAVKILQVWKSKTVRNKPNFILYCPFSPHVSWSQSFSSFRAFPYRKDSSNKFLVCALLHKFAPQDYSNNCCVYNSSQMIIVRMPMIRWLICYERIMWPFIGRKRRMKMIT